MPLPSPLPYRTIKEAAQRHSGSIDEINDDRSGCVTLEQTYLEQDKAFFGAADLQICSSPRIGTRVTFTLMLDLEGDCLRCGMLGGAVARTRSRSRSREDGRAPLRRKPQTVPPRINRTANGHARTPATDPHELPETAKMLAAELACAADARSEALPAEDVELDEVKEDVEEDPKSNPHDAAGGADEAKGPGLDEELRDHLRQELRRTSSGRFRKHLVAFKMWTGVIFKWSVETEEGWLLPDDDIRHECLPTSGLVWFSHDHTEADLPDDAEGRRVQFLVYEQNGSLGAIFVKLVDAGQSEGRRLGSPGSRVRVECRPPSSWQHPNHIDEAEEGEEEDEEDDQEVSGFGASWFRPAEEPAERRRSGEDEDDGWEQHHFEEDDENMDLDEEPPEALAASVSVSKSSAASKSPAKSATNSAPSAPRLPLAVPAARQALQDEVALVAQDLETHWSPAELKRRLMRYLSHGLEKVEKKSSSVESWKEAAQMFLKESSTQFYWTCSGKPWYPEAEERIRPVLEMVAWELIQDCPGTGPGSKEVLQNMIDEEFARYAEQRNFQDTVHNAVAESFNALEDDVRKKVIISLQKMHPSACEAAKAASGHRQKKIEAFVRQWMKDSMDRSYNAVKQQQKDMVFSEKRMTLLFKCLISPEGSEFSCLPRDLLNPDGTGRPPRHWKFIREAVMELMSRWQQNAKK